VNGFKTYEKSFYIKRRTQKGIYVQMTVNKGLYPLRRDKRLKDDFNKSQNQKWRFYKCPRCKGLFKTKEQVTYCSYTYTPKKKDIDRYDAKQSKKQINKIIKNHLETEYPQQVNEIKEIRQVTTNEWVIIGDKEASKKSVKHNILKTFGPDISEDIEKDFYDLFHKGKVTLDEMYGILESIKQELELLD
jgi:hypothetical protein